ncbi:MAG: DUF4157 domain-containing protein, partial [bacterium]
MPFAHGRRQSSITESAPSLQRAVAPAAREHTTAPAAFRHVSHSAAGTVRHAYFGSGMPAEPRVRSHVEAATGRDLSDARVHTGEPAQRMADSVSARAFTVGRDVHFARGQYRPGSADGDALLAHELVHVAQQRTRAVAPGTELSVGDEHSASERQAASIADARDEKGRGDALVDHMSPHIARAPTVETKEVKGITFKESEIAAAHGEGFWEPLLSTVYDVRTSDRPRWTADHEERDAIGAEAWAQHLMLQPLTKTVTITRVLPPRVPGTKPIMYVLQFVPAAAPSGRRGAPPPKPTLNIEFVAEGAGVTAANAPTPASAPQLPTTINEMFFPAGGFTAFMTSFPDEVLQLFNWVNALAPQGDFSRVVHTSTPATKHETFLLVKGTKKGTVTSNIGVHFLGFSAPPGALKTGTYGYRWG